MRSSTLPTSSSRFTIGPALTPSLDLSVRSRCERLGCCLLMVRCAMLIFVLHRVVDGASSASDTEGYRRAAGQTPHRKHCIVDKKLQQGHDVSCLILVAPPSEYCRWRASWWMLPAWPFIALASVWYMFLLPRLRGPYLLADSFEYMGARNQVRCFAQRDFQAKGLPRALGLRGCQVRGALMALVLLIMARYHWAEKARSSARHPYNLCVLGGPAARGIGDKTIARSLTTQPFYGQRLDRDHLRQQCLAICGRQGASWVYLLVS